MIETLRTYTFSKQKWEREVLVISRMDSDRFGLWKCDRCGEPIMPGDLIGIHSMSYEDFGQGSCPEPGEYFVRVHGRHYGLDAPP